MTDERDKQVKYHLREALKLLENIPEDVKQKAPEISPRKSQEGTDFTGIHAKDIEFDLHHVTIEVVYDRKDGVTNGKPWEKQSLMISDYTGQQRELIAWGDHMNHFAGLKKDQVITVLCVGKCTEYKGKLQFTLGSNSEVEVIGGQHRL